MRISHIYVYHELETQIGQNVRLFTYDVKGTKKLYRYSIYYDTIKSKIVYEIYDVFTAMLLNNGAYDIGGGNGLMELDRVSYVLETIFEGQLIFTSFKSFIEHLINEVKFNSISLTAEDLEELINVYPESFI